MLKAKLESLQLPKLLQFKDGNPVRSAQEWQRRREEILDLLCQEEYGLRPADPLEVFADVKHVNATSCAGKVLEQHITISAKLDNGTFSFPLCFFKPKAVDNPMTIVYIAFRPDIPDRYLPIEELTDEGFSIAMFCYKDVAADQKGDFDSGLAGFLKKSDQRPADDTGKIMMWAWAASRVMDYLLTRDDIDHRNIGVMGHSRLGKTALVAAAYDQRFAFSFPNNSGCSGDAITREKEGERIQNITEVFPYWFCPNYKKYAGNEAGLPFDQHFLVAAIAPRFVCAGTAIEDTWADPKSQYLSYVAADEVYKLLGKDGFIHPDRMPEAGDTFHQGTLGFHLRSGTHYHSRYDWLKFFEFMRKHRIRE